MKIPFVGAPRGRVVKLYYFDAAFNTFVSGNPVIMYRLRTTTLALLAFSWLAIGFGSLQAQRTCHTDAKIAEEMATPEGRARMADFSKRMRQYADENAHKTATATYIVPTVVHVIQPTSTDDLSDQCIIDAIASINLDFHKMNADTTLIPQSFQSIAGDASIEFCLATIDDNGQPTNGIVRIVDPNLSTHSTSQEAQMKGLSQWTPTKYLNIWVPSTISGGVLGYATFPTALSSNPAEDGIVVAGNYFGVGPCATSPFDRARTITHEIGHWLGLYHTFQGGCDGTTAGDCATGGDEVCDTPPTSSSNFGCPTAQNTCTETPNDMDDMTMNYMDYVDDACMVMFSAGQALRMQGVLNNERQILVSQSNHTETGCGCSSLTPCTPVANFGADNQFICPNQTVNFFDNSTGPATTWTWSFPGGNPSTATTQNPSVTYTTPGTYSVTLSVTNGLGSDSKTETTYITVVQASPPPVSEGFETTLPSDWVIQNADNSGTWLITNTVASLGVQSMWMDQWSYDAMGSSDAIVTRLIDLSQYGVAELSFDWAYQQAAFINDTMNVWVSGDCGETWNLEWSKGGSSLATKSGIGIAVGFVPVGISEWDSDTLDLSAYLGSDGVKVRFEAIGWGGQNLYLDNINLSGIVGTPDPVAGANWNMNVHPNPFRDQLFVQYSVPKKATIDFALIDLSGKAVYQMTAHNLAPGNHQLEIPGHVYDRLPAGVYMLRGTSQLGNISTKVLKMD